MVGTLLGVRNGRSGINCRRPAFCSLLFRTFHWFLGCRRGFQGSICNDDPRWRKGFPAATAVDEGTRGNRNVLYPDLCPAIGRGRPRGKFRSGSDPAAACHPCRRTGGECPGNQTTHRENLGHQMLRPCRCFGNRGTQLRVHGTARRDPC